LHGDRARAPVLGCNKRVALVALGATLALNGARLTATNDQAYAAIMALARGELGREDLAAWVEQHSELQIANCKL
jgi:death-on-curing protein